MGLAITPVAKERDASPLPYEVSEKIGNAQSDGGVSFDVVEGLDEARIAQLRAYSLDQSDTELQQTSDYERFGEGSYQEWYASKERTLFALVEKEHGTLAALVWFGPKPLGRKSMKHLTLQEQEENERAMDSDNWHTIVYRSYVPFRGTGLMKDFIRFCMDTYQARHPHATFWAGIFSANPASIGLAERLGFTVRHTTEQGETIMVKE